MTTPTEPPQSPPPPPPESSGGDAGKRRFPVWAIAVIIGVIVLCCLIAGIVGALSLGGNDGDHNDRDHDDNGPYDPGNDPDGPYGFALPPESAADQRLTSDQSAPEAEFGSAADLPDVLPV
ncbi:MAG TPA: hypothetical protein VKZ67_05285 [Natronosporangium sp.]|nr:hypothetical protein [Natronosporangium sp.]